MIDDDPSSTRRVRLTLERCEGVPVHEPDNLAHASTQGKASRPLCPGGTRAVAKPVAGVAGMFNPPRFPPATG